MDDKKDINIIKEEYKAKMAKNQKESRIIKILIYICVALLFITGGSFFIVRVLMEKTDIFFFENVDMPLCIIIFGITSILLTRLNGKYSTTSDTSKDRMVFVIGIIIAIGGVALLIYNLIS